jgi:hypothetical protein
MPTPFTLTGGTAHTTTVSGLADGSGYLFYVRCQDTAGNANPDDAVIAFEVAATPPPDTTPPVRSNAQPSGTLPAGTSQATLGLTTDENATCRYALVPGIQFGAMPGTFSNTAGIAHSAVATGLVNGGSYSYYVRCQDSAGNANPTDFLIAFTVADPTPPPAGLVAAYGFDEASGTNAFDASGNNLTGTVNGATRTASGRFGGALSFNGTNSTVTVASAAPLDLTTGMTLEAWVNPSSLGSAWRNVIIKERPNGEVFNLYAHTDSGRPVAYIVRASAPNAPQDVQGSTAIPLNSWTHLAVTYDGSVLRLYVNGAEAGNRTVSGSLVTSTGALRIGGNSVWGEYFTGLIDEVRVYNRALTPAEIALDMGRPITP